MTLLQVINHYKHAALPPHPIFTYQFCVAPTCVAVLLSSCPAVLCCAPPVAPAFQVNNNTTQTMYHHLLRNTTSGISRSGLRCLCGISSGSSAETRVLDITRLDGDLNGETNQSNRRLECIYHTATRTHHTSTAVLQVLPGRIGRQLCVCVYIQFIPGTSLHLSV